MFLKFLKSIALATSLLITTNLQKVFASAFDSRIDERIATINGFLIKREQMPIDRSRHIYVISFLDSKEYNNENIIDDLMDFDKDHKKKFLKFFYF